MIRHTPALGRPRQAGRRKTTRGQRSASGRSRRSRRRKFIRGPSQISHESVDDFLRSLPKGEAVGKRPELPIGHTRVVYQNIHGLPGSPHHDKQTQMARWFEVDKVRIALFSETNTHWPSLPDGTSWRDRLRMMSLRGYYDCTAHNTHQNR